MVHLGALGSLPPRPHPLLHMRERERELSQWCVFVSRFSASLCVCVCVSITLACAFFPIWT